MQIRDYLGFTLGNSFLFGATFKAILVTLVHVDVSQSGHSPICFLLGHYFPASPIFRHYFVNFLNGAIFSAFVLVSVTSLDKKSCWVTLAALVFDAIHRNSRLRP